MASSFARRSAARRSAQLAERAREQRSALTPSEAALWELIRGGRLGVVFRRQVVVGAFVADFAAASARVIVEVDGPYHARRRCADRRRDEMLRRLGWQVVRVSAALVLERPREAVAVIAAAVGR
jgi:very-short-patch-repair endonuclease